VRKFATENAEYDDVLALLPNAEDPSVEDDERESGAEQSEGFV
jgi:hypothetical protein